jgi:predicted metalloprotease
MVAGIAVLVALAGCSAGTVAGRGVAAPASLCAGETDPARLVACVVADLSRTWTARIGEPVTVRVTVDPEPAQVHRGCRSFLAFGTAFYCPADDRAYLTAESVRRDRAEFGDRLPYALASVVAHEAGHRVQYAIDEPGLDVEGDAASRVVEQQADCLAGSWAAGAARRGLVDPAAFRAVYAREMELVSALKPPPGAGLDDYDEVATHGTPAERVAAFDRGAAGADPMTACALRRG